MGGSLVGNLPNWAHHGGALRSAHIPWGQQAVVCLLPNGKHAIFNQHKSLDGDYNQLSLLLNIKNKASN